MNRRETIKSLLAGSLAGSFLLTSCAGDSVPPVKIEDKSKEDLPGYGRTKEEKEKDRKVLDEIFLTSHEIETIAHLCDIILPKKGDLKSAVDAGVVDFIDFIVKDLSQHQTPIRGGIMWIDTEMGKRHNKDFIDCSEADQKALCDQIAFYKKTPEHLKAGESFFSLMRNLVLTGYYTSSDGFKDHGYKGNTPNVWDGVPQEVLDKHGMVYEEEWLKKCVDQSKREVIAEWDEEGNLLT